MKIQSRKYSVQWFPMSVSILERIPAKEQEHWFLIRVEFNQRVLFLINQRPNIVRTDFLIFRELRNLMRVLIPGQWDILRPLYNLKVLGVQDSAVTMCLNIAAFAYNKPSADDIDKCFSDVFAYTTDNAFLRKAKHYIATTATEQCIY